jgi:hypothetical protein
MHVIVSPSPHSQFCDTVSDDRTSYEELLSSMPERTYACDIPQTNSHTSMQLNLFLETDILRVFDHEEPGCRVRPLLQHSS